MSVLAHIVLNGSLPAEPAATRALAHILNSSPHIARAFVAMLRPASVDFEPGHIKAEFGHEDSRPDLTIHDSHGRVRTFVENKFWAGLTDAQPVSYLGGLPDDPPASLLFIVPQRRVATVWNELKLRCSQAELEWVDAPGREQRHLLPRRLQGHAGHELGLTSWKACWTLRVLGNMTASATTSSSSRG